MEGEEPTLGGLVEGGTAGGSKEPNWGGPRGLLEGGTAGSKEPNWGALGGLVGLWGKRSKAGMLGTGGRLGEQGAAAMPHHLGQGGLPFCWGDEGSGGGGEGRGDEVCFLGHPEGCPV